MLRGSIANVHATCESFKDVSIYDDTGHVDLSFLEVMLKLLNEVKFAELCLTRKLAYLLAPDFADETEGNSSGKQDGKKLSAEEVLKQCTFKDNILYLPNVQLSKKTYADVKLWIEEAGGKWTGGKVQGFSFDFDATRVADILMEGNFVFTESGLIENVIEVPPKSEGSNTTYLLELQKRWKGDFTAFKENDVILASVNALATGGKYYDMWMRVLSVNTVKNTIEVVSYPDNEVPSGANHPPCELARLIRWGNAVEEDRQSCWYISSSEGLLVWLDHVTKPIIDKSNYSLAIGKLPDALHFVFANYPLADKRDGAFYAKYLAVQNIIRTDYQGNVKQDVIDRGKWSLDTAKGEEPYRCIATEVHDVWHYGCRWRCLEDKTQTEPKYASTGWAFVEGNPEFKVEMTSSQGWSFDCDEISKLNGEGQYNVFTTLSFEATLYNRSVNDYVEAQRVIWTRDTGNVQEDNAWAIEHADAGFSVPITWKDLGTNADERWSCKFKVEVELLEETVQPSSSRVAYAESSIFV